MTAEINALLDTIALALSEAAYKFYDKKLRVKRSFDDKKELKAFRKMVGRKAMADKEAARKKALKAQGGGAFRKAERKADTWMRREIVAARGHKSRAADVRTRWKDAFAKRRAQWQR